MNRLCQHNQAHPCFWFLLILFLLIAGRGRAEPAVLSFEVQVRVEADKIVFRVTNLGPAAVLGENLVVEQWDEIGRVWRFAASPLWQCGTKETVFAKPLAAAEQIEIGWNKSLHKGCLKAGPGRYRVSIKDPQGSLQSLPVEFELTVVVEKVRNPESRETIYRIVNGECSLSWVLRDAESDQGVALYRPTCSLPFRDQTLLMSELLKAVVQSGMLPQAEWTLYWGRLTPSNGKCFELSQRLMLAAHQSKDWDVKRGKPKQGHENSFVRLVMEQTGIYSELKEIFQAQGLLLRVSNVEKVLILKAKDLPCYANLKSRGVGPEEKLPFDCQVWLRVQAKHRP
ncbi:MAG: hypothetical protein EHM45_02325 [Desulfobacteraceae bacterium]|nr:MAG: hypothetical protein EHM45_02325 [Desulfobacteraceae bacterium]